MAQLFANAARSLLMAGISAVDTSITVDLAKADLFPVADTGTDPVPTVGKDWFKVVLQDNTGAIEIIYVRTRTAGSASMTNCLRGQDGTTAIAFLAGSIVGLRHTAADLADATSFATGASAFWKTLVGWTTAALSRVALGASIVGDALFTAADEDAALDALGAGAAGKAVIAATTEDNARSAINAAEEGDNNDILKLLALEEVPAIVSALETPDIPQCVLSGPVDSSGYAAFGGSVGTATLTAAGTLKTTCYAGNGLHYTGSITNPAWTSPPGSGTGYMYNEQVTPGVVTTGVSTLPWIEQHGGTPSIVTGQHTVNTQEGKVYVGNGATATQVYRNLVGECPHTAGAWSGTIVWYAVKRYYEGVSSSAPSTTRINFNHNLGVKPKSIRMTLVCVTTDLNYAVGAEIEIYGVGGSDGALSIAVSNLDTKSAGVIASTSALSLANASSGTFSAITPSRWKTKIYIRG